jgi:hypothetical protein
MAFSYGSRTLDRDPHSTAFNFYLIQCCRSGMFIPDPKTATKERGEKKFVVLPFL